jgi:hypothetical protein
VKGLVESGKICSVEVLENSEHNSEKKRCYANTLRPRDKEVQNLEGA